MGSEVCGRCLADDGLLYATYCAEITPGKHECTASPGRCSGARATALMLRGCPSLPTPRRVHRVQTPPVRASNSSKQFVPTSPRFRRTKNHVALMWPMELAGRNAAIILPSSASDAHCRQLQRKKKKHTRMCGCGNSFRTVALGWQLVAAEFGLTIAAAEQHMHNDVCAHMDALM